MMLNQQELFDTEQSRVIWRKQFLSSGLLIGLVANALGFAAGAVFFTAENGARFRGMETQAKVFISLSLLAAAVGLLVGLPASINDLRRNRWGGGLIGFTLALTPIFVAGFVAKFAASVLNRTWD